ncbi:hypothetical protein CASFOL_017468 [Castilleja foliolosa]|uniref:Helitron helicase-like domain-containing protein n=1 Tax=Castilleja foliolosa TaxID=1961234 RepID=A0ABD3DB56_9LAMI
MKNNSYDSNDPLKENSFRRVINNSRRPGNHLGTQVQTQNINDLTPNNSFVDINDYNLVENSLTYGSDVPVGTIGLLKTVSSVNTPQMFSGSVLSSNTPNNSSKRLKTFKDNSPFRNFPLSDITNVIDNDRRRGQLSGTPFQNQNLTDVPLQYSYIDLNDNNLVESTLTYGSNFPVDRSGLSKNMSISVRSTTGNQRSENRNYFKNVVHLPNSPLSQITNVNYNARQPSQFQTLHEVIITSEQPKSLTKRRTKVTNPINGIATVIDKPKRSYVRRKTASNVIQPDCLPSSSSCQIENQVDAVDVTQKQPLPRKNISRRSRRSVLELCHDKNVIDHPNLPSEYGDLGDASYECRFCRAAFWLDERCVSKGSYTHPYYNGCCQGGNVDLPRLVEPPAFLRDLLHGKSSASKHFQENIRSYNSMFCLTSMGGKIDQDINKGSGPRIFRLHGQNYHLIGSLLPEKDTTPKFAQMYIYDTENEVSNRKNSVS